MTSSSTTREERAKSRSSWPMRRYSLGDEPTENLQSSTTAEERLAMMWELSRQAWELSGRGVPDYLRSRIPGRVIRSQQ